MRLVRLKIHTLPGIDPEFPPFEPPEADIVLVTGPNAIGKSSLVRALTHLLAPDPKSDPPALSLEADLSSGSMSWNVRRNGSQVLWTRNGEPTARPSLPASDQIKLYRLSMEHLMAHDHGDRTLAEQIWQELRGGFDLDVLRINLGPRWARPEASALNKARQALNKMEGENRALRAEQADLPELERNIEAAEQSAEQVTYLQQALELHERIKRRVTCEQALERFANDMDKLRGNELELLDKWEEEAKELAGRVDEQVRERAAAQEGLEATGLSTEAPSAEDTERIEGQLRKLDNTAAERRRTLHDLTEAESDLDDALKQFKGHGGPPDLQPGSLTSAETLVGDLIVARTRRKERQVQLDLAGEPPDPAEIDQHRGGVEALRAWLAASPQAEDGTSNHNGRTRWFQYAAIALAALTALAAFAKEAYGAVAGALVAAVALLGALISGRRTAVAQSPADRARRQFEETGIEPPSEWSRDAVRERLTGHVEPRLNRLIQQRDQALEAPKLRLEIEADDAEIMGLEEQKTNLAQAIGIDPQVPAASFHRFIDLTGQWDRARQKRQKLQAIHGELESQIAEECADVRSFLCRWQSPDSPPLDDANSDAAIDQLRIAFGALNRRLREAKEAHGTINSKDSQIQSLYDNLKRLGEDVDSLYQSVGLASGERGELEGRIGQLSDWKKADDALTEAKQNERSSRESLRDKGELVAAVDNGEIDLLRDRLDREQDQADGHTKLIDQRARILERIEKAEQSQGLEEAASHLEQAKAALEDKRDAAFQHEATEVLLDEIETQFKSEHEPDLLRRAKERFEQVTAHEFSLELRNGNRFAARDLKQGQLRTLEELSSGTRMQLLLALRLAWTETQEQGSESLPLFLDEALTTSDEDRFAVMANTLTRLAEAGDRQIFYLSARRHERALWKQATGTEPPMVDLAEVRFGRADLKPEDFQVETPASLPDPAGQDAATYAALLGVPRLDPHLEPGGIHLFHLLRDDLELLHRLMATWRIATLGQLESLLASNAAEGAIADTAARNLLRQRCEAARAWIDLWRQGRGRPVNRAALEQSGAVSDTFIDQAAELADGLQGDGTALINALRQGRLPRFHTTKTDELEQWLSDEGYTDKQSRLSSDERRRLTLATVAPQNEEDATSVNRLVDWLESAASHEPPKQP